MLTSKQGVKVFVPAGSFDSESNHLLVTMEEFTNERDLFLAQLTTHSNQTPLVSGGTVKLNAWVDGKEVGIKKGKEGAVIFKRNNNSTDEILVIKV